MSNKVTLTKPDLIDFITETVKEIVDNNQQEKILHEQGILDGLFGDQGTITPYTPEEAQTEIPKLINKIDVTKPKDAYDVLKMFDEMLLQGIDVRRVLIYLIGKKTIQTHLLRSILKGIQIWSLKYLN